MTTQEFIEKALSADGLQDAIKKAELSDTIFETLSPAYAETVKLGMRADWQKEYLMKEAEYEIQVGGIPNTVTPTEAVEDFLNRL